MDAAVQFVKDAPPGEVLNIINDIKAIFDDQQVHDQVQNCELLAYYMENYQHVELMKAGRSKTLVTRYNQLEGCRFFDAAAKVSFEYNLFEQKPEKMEDYSSAENQEAETIRQAFQARLDEYVEEHYEAGVGLVVVISEQDGSRVIHVCIEGHRYNPKNFWNGRWKTHLEIIAPSTFDDITADNTENVLNDIRGDGKVNVHFYEQGNVHLESKTSYGEFNISTCIDVADYADKFIVQLEQKEQKYHSSLNETYHEMLDNFKTLRRALPITKTKIDWTKLSHHSLKTEMKK